MVNYAGYVLAWGNNNRSQLGNFDSTSCEGQPIQVGTERYLALEPTYTEFFHNSESPSRKETFSSTGANKPPLSITMRYSDIYRIFNTDEFIMEAVEYKGYNLYSDTNRKRSPLDITFESSDRSIVTVGKAAISSDKEPVWDITPTSRSNST